MKIENQLTIQGELDHCIITPKPDDKLNIGSITIKREEAADFFVTLRQAFEQMGVWTEPKQ